jgi:hypothetical protein
MSRHAGQLLTSQKSHTWDSWYIMVLFWQRGCSYFCYLTGGGTSLTCPAVLGACGRLGAKAKLKAFRGSSHTGLLSEDRLISEVVRTANKRPWPAQLGRELRFAWSDLKGLFASRDEGGSMPSQHPDRLLHASQPDFIDV